MINANYYFIRVQIIKCAPIMAVNKMMHIFQMDVFPVKTGARVHGFMCYFVLLSMKKQNKDPSIQWKWKFDVYKQRM